MLLGGYKFEVDMPRLNAALVWTPIFEWLCD